MVREVGEEEREFRLEIESINRGGRGFHFNVFGRATSLVGTASQRE